MNTNISFVRIDNRLVHGQVGITWCAMLGIDVIVVADDEISKDLCQQTLMLMAAKVSHAEIKFMTLNDSCTYLADTKDKRMFLVVRTPSSLRMLIDKGVNIQQVNVGNMHFSIGKHQLSKKVYVDDQDMDDFHYIKSKGITIYIQDVPGDPTINI